MQQHLALGGAQQSITCTTGKAALAVARAELYGALWQRAFVRTWIALTARSGCGQPLVARSVIRRIVDF